MKAPVLALALSLLAGCASMSGLDAKSTFACKAPEGVLCESMSGIYANVQQKNLPGQQFRQPAAAANDRGAAPSQDRQGVLPEPVQSGTPIRTAPRILRVWLAPWEDSDGDLHDQSYVYLTLDTGKWLIEHNRQQIQDRYRPVRPPAAAPAPPVSSINPANAMKPATPDAEVIGIRQDRPTSQDGAAFMNGIATPAGAMQND